MINTLTHLSCPMNLREFVRRLTELHTLALEIVDSHDLPDILGRVLQHAIELLNANGGCIYLVDSNNREVFSIVEQTIPSDKYKGVRLRFGEGAGGWVAENRKPLIIDDYRIWPGRAGVYGDDYVYKSVLSVPLIWKEDILGVLQLLDSQETNRFTEEDQELLSLFASQAALTVQNARLLEGERQQRELSEKIAHAAAVITSSLDLDQVLSQILDQMGQVVPYDSAAVMLWEKDHVHMVASKGLPILEKVKPSNQLQYVLEIQENFPTDDQLLAEIRKTKKPLILKDAQLDERFHRWCATDYVHGWLGIPLIVRDEVIGCLTLDSKLVNNFGADHAKWATTFANHAAAAIENAKLYEERGRRAVELDALRQASLGLTSRLELREVFDAILKSALSLIKGSNNSHIFLYTAENGGKLTFGSALWQDGSRRTSFAEPRENGLTLTVARSGETIVVPDMSKHPLFEEFQLEWNGAIVGIPLKIGLRVVGVMNIAYKNPREFSESELRLLQFLGDQAAIAIENANLYMQAKDERKHLSLLFDIAQELAASLEQDDILLRAVTLTTPALGGLVGLGYLYQTDADKLSLRTIYGKSCLSVHDYNASVRMRPGKGLAGWVAENLQEVLVPEVTVDPRWYHVNGLDENVHSAIAAPIVYEGMLFGVLMVLNQQVGYFSTDHLELLKAICHEVGLALCNARRYQEVQRQLKEMTLIQQLAQTISGRLELQVLLEEVVNQLAEKLGYPVVEIYLVQGEFLRLSAFFGNVPPLGIFPFTRGVVGRVAKTGMASLVTDVSVDPDFVNDIPGSIAELAVPIMRDKVVVGVINIETTSSDQLFSRDQEFLELLAGQISIALDNATLYENTRLHADEMEQAVAQRTAQLMELYELSQKIGYTLSYDDLLQALLSHLRNAIGCDFSAGFLVNNLSQTIYVDTIRPFSPDALDDLQTRCWTACRGTGTPVVDSQVQINLSINSRADNRIERISAYYPITLSLKGEKIGLLVAGYEHERPLSDDHQRLLETFAYQAVVALERLEAVREAEKKRLENLVENLPNGVLLLNAEFGILVINPIAADVLNTLMVDISNGVIAKIGSLSIEEIVSRHVENLPLEILLEGQPKRYFEAQACPVGEAKNQWVITLREITTERDNQVRIQMHERLATVGQLAAGIAHDFNNIMAAILVYADLLRNDPSLTDAGKDKLVIIQQQVQRAASLIRQILDFSRRSVMEQSAMDFLPFVKEFEKLLKRVVPETIFVELHYKPGSYMVNADPARLQQVLMNLALNARDAMPDGGLLTFSMDRLLLKPGDTLPLPYLQPGQWIRICARDTGIGISSDDLPHIFEPFYTTKPVGMGTGLGLAQVYGIVKQHGGYIDVQSRVGEGTTFGIYLPALTTLEENGSVDQPSKKMDGFGKTVLLVEDDRATLDALRAMLESQNFKVLTASNGKQALEIFDRTTEDVHLIVSDVVMPRMGGFELFQALEDRRAGIKMLYITGHPVNEDNQVALLHQNVTWLQKPFSVRDFSQAVFSLLS